MHQLDPSFIYAPASYATRLSRANAACQPRRAAPNRVCDRWRASQSQDERTRSHPLSHKFPTARSHPPALRAHHFINLTNGLESLDAVTRLVGGSDGRDSPNIRFTRLQSSHCESGAYDKLLWSVDNELLMSLACGRPCFVHDRGSRDRTRGVPRSLFLGLQFVRWAVAYLWFDATRPDLVAERVLVRGKNVVPFWRDDVLPYKIGKDTKKRVRYFAAFAKEMGTTEVRLFGVYGRTSDVDGCMGVYVKMMREWLEREDVGVGCEEEEEESDEGLQLQVWMDGHKMSLAETSATEDEVVAVQEWMGDDEDRRSRSKVSRDAGQ